MLLRQSQGQVACLLAKQDVSISLGAPTSYALRLGLIKQSGTPEVLTTVTLQLRAAACKEYASALRSKRIPVLLRGYLDGSH